MRPPLDLCSGEKCDRQTVRVTSGIKRIRTGHYWKFLLTSVKLGSGQRRRDCDKLDALNCRNWDFNLKTRMTGSENNAHCHILTDVARLPSDELEQQVDVRSLPLVLDDVGGSFVY